MLRTLGLANDQCTPPNKISFLKTADDDILGSLSSLVYYHFWGNLAFLLEISLFAQ